MNAVSAWITAYGGKTLSWITGVLALLTVPATAASLHINDTDMAWLTVGSAALNMAHAIFFSTEQQQAAKQSLKAP